MADSEREPPLCPCGFWGSSNTSGLCSKCYKEMLLKNGDCQMAVGNSVQVIVTPDTPKVSSCKHQEAMIVTPAPPTTTTSATPTAPATLATATSATPTTSASPATPAQNDISNDNEEDSSIKTTITTTSFPFEAATNDNPTLTPTVDDKSPNTTTTTTTVINSTTTPNTSLPSRTTSENTTPTTTHPTTPTTTHSTTPTTIIPTIPTTTTPDINDANSSDLSNPPKPSNPPLVTKTTSVGTSTDVTLPPPATTNTATETTVVQTRSVSTETDNKGKRRCNVCKVKLPLTSDLTGRCKCEGIFCDKHRLPEQHACSFDHKAVGRKEAKEKMVSPKKHVGTSLRRLDSDS